MTRARDKDMVPGIAPALTALVLHPSLRGDKSTRDQRLKLEEATGLALAIGLKVALSEIVDLAQARPATYLGKGKVEEFSDFIEAEEIDLVIMDCALNPIQQRNLERAWKVKVIDRTGLILEIFGERARTAEGTLQVELAHLTYQKSRLVRTWTHLERQRGGFGFLGGPGERQIEADRRQIQDRITRIKKNLVTVAKRRSLHRKARKAVPYPIIALAGYTNAGKSTLFNRLTGAMVDAEDKLFATLDPTLRAITLPSGRKVILSDTVGFISNLPIELVAAFRATLEEVREADLILHIRDASNPEAAAQRDDVLEVLNKLDIDPDTPMLDVMNKIDLVREEDAEVLHNICARKDDHLALSAINGQGVEDLLAKIENILEAGEPVANFTIDSENGKARSWLHQHGKVLKESQNDKGLKLEVRLAEKFIGQFKKEFPGQKVAVEKKFKYRKIA